VLHRGDLSSRLPMQHNSTWLARLCSRVRDADVSWQSHKGFGLKRWIRKRKQNGFEDLWSGLGFRVFRSGLCLG
jgi:hypothetical protein